MAVTDKCKYDDNRSYFIKNKLNFFFLTKISTMQTQYQLHFLGFHNSHCSMQSYMNSKLIVTGQNTLVRYFDTVGRVT